MEKYFDYAKIKEKIYDYYCHTTSSLSKKINVSYCALDNFLNPEKIHRFYKDMIMLAKIAFALNVEVSQLIA